MDQSIKATSTDCLYPSEQTLPELLGVDITSFVLIDIVEHQPQLLLRQIFIYCEHHVAELFVVYLVVLIYVKYTQQCSLVDCVVFYGCF